ncbi:hypothetical protein PHYBLDRAFT_73929 [Phycomyces blakesleeanus NRRL 1555(-)]|uniref:Reverse transcriptase zinc-binding domain-containing protein n=1 Tax=Phycomyces blakesleeanus (strain ATCC 8743b / DSM 1359 / FGSC 10004 / NBRC 33097 / NRRL 1555) TaxID=763407 RepID=A0A167KBZ0_PHYB8|nr:hypothetical protein PHYBLDRAFT_73929 [Phycomyces blakesleeanus NRRL 1555(-)]OAD67719.1 hypothetical protein PHYBLDRAFT_73929 [Phycomyces blakesleeanus NRRL 1555(-)]|eukprot:XP_018285759.1 hypothetical protein PHYBLDRAFT_73929 [Phycomyces blakesleeanus NRRL 1555(-)]
MGRFLQHQSFPPIRLDTLCLPTKMGGLGVLNPKLQQGALQLRWLRPLFQSASSPSGLVLPWLLYLLQHYLPDVHLHLPFIFSDLRHPRLRTYISPFFNLFAACNLLPHDFDSTVINLLTCLDIPLASAVVVPHGLPAFPASWRHLQIQDAYEINTTLDILSCHLPSSFPHSPCILHKVLQRVDDHSLFLHAFVIRACLPQSILTEQFPDLMAHTGTEVDPSTLLSALSPTFPWKRLMYHTTYEPSNGVNSGLSSFYHFLYACPLKLPLWHTLWLTHFGFSPQFSDIHNVLYKFSFPPPLDPTSHPASILGSVLLALWRHHWAFIFNQSPFVAANATTTASSLLSHLQSEENLDQRPFSV